MDKRIHPNDLDVKTDYDLWPYKLRLSASLSMLASLIDAGNENLWPIFEKLEGELHKIEINETRLSKYLEVQKAQPT